MDVDGFFAGVLETALESVRVKRLPVYTFAFYHDHESNAVSVCVDTEENSEEKVIMSNRYSMKYFERAVSDGDLSTAALWNANIGRNLSLGDFVEVNLARSELYGLEIDEEFHLKMVRAVVKVQNAIAELSTDRDRLLFVYSGPNEEVGFVWSLVGTDETHTSGR